MIKVIVSVLLLALLCCGIGYQQLQSALKMPLKVENSTLFKVERGTGFNQLCQAWQAKQWLDSCFKFQVLAKLDPTLTDLKAGLYELDTSAVIDNIRRINEGAQVSFSFTIIEGQPLREVVANIAKQPHLTQDLDPENLATQISSTQENLEGWLFPDTYHYHSEDSASGLLKRAYSKMQQELEAAWQNRAPDLVLNSPYEALILASIIEKETGLASERPLISAVFTNRLKTNMRLQTDPTVIYGIGADFDGDIKRKDLTTYTPYNTYKIKGLPPT
ncbi:MAG: endolytic transglycosylase MltG, partial [Pseudomonadota bacterium]|nr:endolytic transglycosylase MltG [Pseudomonadota bacterium]